MSSNFRGYSCHSLVTGLMAVILLLYLAVPSVAGGQEADTTHDSPGVWYVDGNKTSSGDGTSWGTAFKTIQEAIDACPGWDEIWVK